MISPIRSGLPLAVLAALPLHAQLTYPGCDALQATDFKAVELFNKSGTNGAARDADLSEPTRMDVHVVNKADGTYDHTDVIFVERLGAVKWYDGTAKTVTKIGSLQVHAGTGSQDDNGLMGVVFDPGFDTNRWIYLWYTPRQTVNQAMTGTGSNRQMRLSRFTLKADNTLDTGSEKSLLKILGSKTDQWHCGGPMAFDSYGDLWIAVGNNSPDLDPTACNAGNNVLSKTDSTQSAEWGPSDTHNMRGSFLRIHPDNSAKGYSVPSGNFGEYWADQFERQGNATLAAQYRDTTKVLPEIYVKGERSNFSIAVHPTKRWLAWGTVNYASNNDEFTITDHPIFSGFPYFMQNNVPTCSHGKSVSAPTNESPFNGGVKTLPPATPGTLNNIINVAIGGPIYSFDPTLKSTEKFPPHFDNKWIVAGFGRSGQPWDMWAVTLDDTKQPFAVKDRVSLKSGLFKNVPIRNFIGAAYGKDGALYILNYDGDYNAANNPGLVRVTYTGACQVVSNKPRPAAEAYQKVWFDPYGIMVGEKGAHSVSLYDMAGQRVWSGRGDGPREYKFSALRAEAALKPGLYLARVNTSIGEKVRTVSIF